MGSLLFQFSYIQNTCGIKNKNWNPNQNSELQLLKRQMESTSQKYISKFSRVKKKHTTKVYRGHEGNNPCIIDINTKCR